jgi:Cys-rich repeat protein
MSRAVLLAALVLLVSACNEALFPACKQNKDCPSPDAGTPRVCVNLRCVECGYDSDCPPGRVCTTGHICQSIDGRIPDPSNAPPASGK